jgi:hypothetical protein
MTTTATIDIDRLIRDLGAQLMQPVQPPAEQPEQLSKLDELYQQMEDGNIDYMMKGGFHIIVEMQYEDKPIKCILDTGAQKNIMDVSCMTRLGISDMVDREHVGKIKGVGGLQQTYGFAPYIPLSVGNYSCPTCFIVSELTGLDCDCLIGILFMRFYGIVIDLDKNTVKISGVDIPFQLTYM